MNNLFNKLGLAVTFSPTGIALLKETKRLKDLFDSELTLIHVGIKSESTEKQLSDAINDSGLNENETEIIWTKGDPANSIIKSAKSAGVNLLIAGALEKEKFIKYYIGSVARKLMRNAQSSVLILKSPSENPKSFKKFYVSTDYSVESEKTVKILFQFALKENAEEFVVIRDYYIPGLVSTIQNSGSLSEFELIRNNLQQEEEEKLKLFVRELNLKGLEVKTICLYGKEGWEANNFAKENKADIFGVTAPLRRLKLLDRLFQHEIEYSFENLPSNLLIVR